MMSLLNIMIFATHKTPITVKMMNSKANFKMKCNMSILMDKYFMFFSTAALMVTWSIMEFSTYYMKADPHSKKFFRLLTIFMLKMLILTSAKKLFLFFMGWEGVGILSFLLIGWWFTRKEANSSALQAMIYKRMGDMGMMMLMSSTLILTKSWDILKMKFKNSIDTKWQKMMLFASLMAAMGKSAQFSLHPWLPAAMEGPTPVSALLHSSTMVVAGVFLLMRMTSEKKNFIFLYMCSMMGALTAMFAATSAFRQHDMKKIMAYSTTSQLGLMVLSMGTGKPKMALFHMCTHAFFKAMLFLCSGSIIHSHKNEQDLRKIKKMKTTLPITSACLLLGSISLMGIPFLSGFFSKDTMMESMMENPNNIVLFILTMSATFLTAAYSFRMISLCFYKNTKAPPMNPMKEENYSLQYPLMRLAIGTIITGWMLSKWLFKTPSLFPQKMMKTTPLIMTMAGAVLSSTIVLSLKTKMNFYSKAWFFQQMTHTITKKMTAKMALMMSTRTLDRGWKESMGGQGIFKVKKSITQKNQMIQSGYMKQYFLSMFITSLCFLIIHLKM